MRIKFRKNDIQKQTTDLNTDLLNDLTRNMQGFSPSIRKLDLNDKLSTHRAES